MRGTAFRRMAEWSDLLQDVHSAFSNRALKGKDRVFFVEANHEEVHR